MWSNGSLYVIFFIAVKVWSILHFNTIIFLRMHKNQVV